MKASIRLLSMSMTKSLGVCLLKPNFSSNTNVLYIEVGSDNICEITMKDRTKTIECEISPVNLCGANRTSQDPVTAQSLGRTSK